MSIDQHRAMLTGRIWQSIAQSGVDLSSLAREQQERLVGAIADGVLVGVDDLLGQIAPAAPPADAADPEDPSAERTLWEGRPFLSLTERYTVTSERVRIQRGLLGKDFEEIELIRLQDIDRGQSAGERLLNIGDISLRSADPSKPTAVLRNVGSPDEVHEIIRRAWLEARKRYGFQFREQM
ncbi:MAG: PH domain-containing protein [Kouleothrix sp.]|nr:PH domain-containing protein [Kouleothrix sp.]